MMEFDQVVITSRNETGLRSKVKFSVGKLIFPTFEIASSPTIRLSDIKSRRFSLIDRDGK